ncbi:unnamed protein product [Choristocarpus tenellus]
MDVSWFRRFQYEAKQEQEINSTCNLGGSELPSTFLHVTTFFYISTPPYFGNINTSTKFSRFLLGCRPFHLDGIPALVRQDFVSACVTARAIVDPSPFVLGNESTRQGSKSDKGSKVEGRDDGESRWKYTWDGVASMGGADEQTEGETSKLGCKGTSQGHGGDKSDSIDCGNLETGVGSEFPGGGGMGKSKGRKGRVNRNTKNRGDKQGVADTGKGSRDCTLSSRDGMLEDKNESVEYYREERKGGKKFRSKSKLLKLLF